MEFTGERFVPSCSGEIALEHYHRYFFALPLVKGKRVLDIASGEGYGSHMLAREAAFVTGVDIASDAVTWSTEKYACASTRFLQGSVTDIPLADASVDVVVSFETLEHVTGQEQEIMLREIRRVLVPDGLLIISTPNVDIFDSASNHFHVKELRLDEFSSLLFAHFKHQAIVGQKVAYGSMILGSVAFDRVLDMEGGEADFLPRARYFIALASDKPLPPMPGSFLEGALEDSDSYRNLMGNCTLHESEHRKAKALLLEMENRLNTAEALKKELAAMNERLAAFERQAQEARSTLDAVFASRSWRLTKPLRYAAKYFRKRKS